MLFRYVRRCNRSISDDLCAIRNTTLTGDESRPHHTSSWPKERANGLVCEGEVQVEVLGPHSLFQLAVGINYTANTDHDLCGDDV